MKKIAILGASEPHLPLFFKAKEMGLEIYCFAWKEGAYCKEYADHYYDISITDKERIAKICEDEHIDGIISNALEIAVPTVAYVCEILGLNGIPYSVALNARDKYQMRERISHAKACLQPRYILYSPSYVPSSYPVIVKPIDGSCSNGVTKVNSPEEWKQALQRAVQASSNASVLIEEYIEGREVSVESISFHGQHYVLMVTDKETTGAPYFVETAHHQPSNLPQKIQGKIKSSVKKVLDAMGICNGASHAEFKIDKDENLFFIEVGARGGGDFISYELVKLSIGYDYVRGMIEVALNTFHIPKETCHKYAGVYFLSKEVAYVGEFIKQNEEAEWVVKSHIEEEPLRCLKKSQDRSGYVIYQADYRITIPEDLKNKYLVR